ncbi:MAG TPA: hypothetical protein VHC46_01040, partial [Thermodesulfobacteriota bacterium]|nr:hypothetical protein [Thermodesulfobacteriota bacterium]
EGFVINDSSRPRPVAIRIGFKKVSVLTGEGFDNGPALSSIMEKENLRLRSSVLFLDSIEGDSSFLAFLRAVSPRTLITNEPIQPNDGDKSGMREALTDVTVFDTSADGQITLRSDGSGIGIETYVGEKKADLK